MSSPVKIPFKSIITISREEKPSVYLQIAQQIIRSVQHGILLPGMKLPGSRALSAELGIHRKTVIAAYAELEAQGWVEALPNRGSFIAGDVLKEKGGEPIAGTIAIPAYPAKTGYTFRHNMLLDKPKADLNMLLEFTDGLPDIRIAPFNRLANTYSGIMKRKNSRRYLNYSQAEGNEYYREMLADYLNSTRGLHISKENILSTRGVQMGIFLAAGLLISPGDLVVVGKLGYYAANMIFQQAGASLLQLAVDEEGISTEALKEICTTTRIRMVYLTPSHHYPTTATLSARRRMELLELSVKYGFIILEDDYDYDFNYNGSALLPLASMDNGGMVIYTGSFCKILAPGLRMGYLIAPRNLIEELGRFRQIIDRQGDMVMEQALAELIAEGEIQRHLKKATKIYQERRDALCSLLGGKLGSFVQFEKPQGGLSLWTRWDPGLNLMRISRNCKTQGLYLPQTLLYQNESVTAMKLGFGNLNPEELGEAVTTLEESVLKY